MDHLIVIAFPDFYIQYHEVWHRVVWKFLGFTEGNTIRAGHNCAILVDGSTGKLQYFDFGRYDVPDGFGRARCAESDPQLNLDAIAEISNGKITNLDTIMQDFYHDDSIHHSAGPMFYKVLPDIKSSDVLEFVERAKSRGFVDYDIFRKGALNCSRYIGHLVKAVLSKNRITTYLKYICPSPTPMDTVINVDVKSPLVKYDGMKISEQPFSAWLGIKYYLKSRGAFHNDTTKVEMPGYHWIGSKAIGSYYQIREDGSNPLQYIVSKYSAKGVHISDREYTITKKGVNLSSPFSLQLGKSPNQLVLVQDSHHYQLTYFQTTIESDSVRS